MNLEERWRPVLFAAALALLLLHAGLYWPFLSDDALISLRYAQRLLEGRGLTWNDGLPRVEGYSNLLWVLSTAGLGALGLDLILAARMLGVTCLAGVLAVLTWRQGGPALPAPKWMPVLPGAMFFSLAAPSAVWAIGGLELPLTAFLLAIAIPPCFRLLEDPAPRTRDALPAAIPLGLMCLTRPDGFLFTVGALGAITLARRVTSRALHLSALLLLALIPLATWGGQLVFRLAYYGEWLPNTALAKLSPSLHHLAGGVLYVAHGLLALAPFSLAALWWMAGACLARQPRAILLATLTVLWLCYVAAVGGDYFPAFRFFLPILVVFAFALGEAIDDWHEALHRWWRTRRAATWMIGAAGLALFLGLQRLDSGSRHAAGERWEWQGREIALALKDAFGAQQPLLAVTAAGCLPYWSELPCLDMLGLNDHYLARHPPEDFGEGRLGHELGDAGYVLDRQPEIICFHMGELDAGSASGRDLQSRPEFRAAYVAVPLRLEQPWPFTATLWFRQDSPKVGLRRDKTGLRVPGHLLTANPATLIRPRPGGWAAEVREGRPAEILLKDFSGRWRVEVDRRASPRVRVEQLQEGADLRLLVHGDGMGPVLVDELTLTPIPEVPSQ